MLKLDSYENVRIISLRQYLSLWSSQKPRCYGQDPPH